MLLPFCPFCLNCHLPLLGPETHSLQACLSLCPSSNRILSLLNALEIRRFLLILWPLSFKLFLARLPHGNLGEPNTKLTFRSPYIWCCSLIRIVFCHVNRTIVDWQLIFYDTIHLHLYFYFNIARDVGFAYICWYLSFNHTFTHAHIEARSHEHTCMISTQEKCREPGSEAWLGEAEEMFFFRAKVLAPTKKNDRISRSQIQKKIQANRASSKATRLFLMK